MAREFIYPDWPAPPRVRAASTTRTGGMSVSPYDSLNLGMHVGDATQVVAANRAYVSAALALPEEPLWLDQVHGTRVIDANTAQAGTKADGSYSTRAGVVCAVMTADCLPVLLCNQAGTCVAALHAGWRGLAGGVLEAGIAAMGGAATELMAWMGPAIGPQAFEVGEVVRHAFVEAQPAAGQAFIPTREGHYLADLYALARLRLMAAGVSEIFGGGFCTCSESARFYSYRRDKITGRMASLIWLEQ